MTTLEGDPLQSAIGNALNALVAARDSQDLAAKYRYIGDELADAGRQPATDSEIREVARRCANAVDISDLVKVEAYGESIPLGRRAVRERLAEEVTDKSIAQLHLEGLKADRQDIRQPLPLK